MISPAFQNRGGGAGPKGGAGEGAQPWREWWASLQGEGSVDTGGELRQADQGCSGKAAPLAKGPAEMKWGDESGLTQRLGQGQQPGARL